jgi:hypothetical protein
VPHLELPVAEVDDIALVDQPGHPCRPLAEGLERHPDGQRVDEVFVGHRVPRGVECLDHLATPCGLDVETRERRVLEQVGLERMCGDVGELVVTTDVVVVSVCGDGHDGPSGEVEQVARGIDDARQAHAGVDEQVAVAPAHVPDVAAHQRHDVRLPEQGHGVVDRRPCEPAVGEREHRRSVGLRAAGRSALCRVGRGAIVGGDEEVMR